MKIRLASQPPVARLSNPSSGFAIALAASVLAGTLAGMVALPDCAAAADKLPAVSANSSASASSNPNVAKFNNRGPDYDPSVGSSEDHETLNEIRTLINAGRIQETIDKCIELIESGNRQGETLFIYGRALSVAALPGRASWALDAAMDDPNWIVSAAHQLAQGNYQNANYELVIEVLDRLEANRLDPDTNDLFAMVLRGRAYLGTRRQYDEALEAFEHVLELEPEHEEALRLKGVALLGLKRSDEAWEIIEQGRENASEAALALGASDREAYWCGIQVTFNREAGNFEKAEEILVACLADYPTTSALIKEASDLYASQGQYERIVEVMQAAHAADPDSIELRQALVLQLRAMGRRDEAEKVLRESIERTPDELAAEPWVALAGFLIDSDRLDEGLKAYAEAMKRLNGTLPPELLFSYAEGLVMAGRFDDALAIAEKTPIEVHRPMIRGRVAYERSEYALAQKELNAAAKLWPDNAPVRYYLARAAEGLGDFSTAIEEYRQCMRSDIKLTAAKERLARLHLAEGRVRHAMSILKFSGTEATGAESPDLRLIEIEIQALLGIEPDLSRLVPDPKRSISEIRRLAVEGFARGMRARSGPAEVAAALDILTESVETVDQDLLIGARVQNMVFLNRLKEAENLARQAVKDRPESGAAALALARSLVAQDPDSKEAHILLTNIVDRDHANAEARTTLGELELRAGRAAKSEKLFLEALEIDPDHGLAMRGLINSLSALDRKGDARERLKIYLAREGPYDGQAALQLAMLIEAKPSNLEQRIELTRRALRFGAGQAAVDLLVELDPTIDSPPPIPPSGGIPSTTSDAPSAAAGA